MELEILPSAQIPSLALTFYKLFICNFFFSQGLNYRLQSRQYISHIYDCHPNACIYGCFHEGLK